MSRVQLDTTRACVVMLGAWNPAIFDPRWVAHHLLGHEPGQQIEVKILQRLDEPRQITYIGNLGYTVTATRFELYINGYNTENFQEATSFIGNLTSKLPHTPFGRFGVNFRFIELDPADSLFDQLKSNDSLDVEFALISQDFIAHIRYEDDVQLNWKRIPTEEAVMFEFNYDHTYTWPKSFEKLNAERLLQLRDDSATALKTLYDVSDYMELKHQFDTPDATEGGDHAEN